MKKFNKLMNKLIVYKKLNKFIQKYIQLKIKK